MYRDSDIVRLRNELVETVKGLSPIALKYQYSDVPLEVNIKWRPVVLILGNYSSGKSTLINELLGAEIQQTGQAPTDDSFTVITQSDGFSERGGSAVKVQERRDGKVLLYDEQYPFENLRRHGERFAAHFRLYKVNSPFLSDLALIDTPGMLDSSTELDRGYDYQQVIGDLAQTADLILMMFDPHKAGTVHEAHRSLKETLPARTFEDRVIFVLNRIDECSNLTDLLRVYGTLCWNLSQMIGRKDIPQIHLTFSENDRLAKTKDSDAFLKLLKNQRQELRNRILEAPRYRLDHLASYIETHGERLSHFLEALDAYARAKIRYIFVYVLYALGVGVAAAGVTWILSVNSALFRNAGEISSWIVSGAIGAIVFGIAIALLRSTFLSSFHHRQMQRLDQLTKLPTQRRKDSWAAVSDRVKQYLEDSRGEVRRGEVAGDWHAVEKAYKHGSQEARRALAELGTHAPTTGH